MQVKYRGSAEERADLLQLVTRFRGDMRAVFDWLMLSRPELDSHRFRDTLEEAVAAGALGPCVSMGACAACLLPFTWYP
jgi:DnaJ family protein C protein 9